MTRPSTESTELIKTFAYVKKQVDARIDNIFTYYIGCLEFGAEYKTLLTQTHKLVRRGGKRLRPVLAYTAFVAAGGQPTAAALDCLAALELFHNFLLIHDDIMDGDDRRHGGSNIQGWYTKYYAKRVGLGHVARLAEANAILAGDIVYTMAIDVVERAELPADIRLALIGQVANAALEVAAGQQMDINSSVLTPKQLSTKRLLRIAELKTAGYSVVSPLRFGAILAGQPDFAAEFFLAYGRHVGIAFQLVDDVMGVFGSARNLGKPVCSDIREGKETVLFQTTRSLAEPAQRTVFDKIFGNPKASESDLKKARTVIAESGAKAKTMILAQQHSDMAVELVRMSKLPAAAQATLIYLARFVVERKS